MGNQNAEERIQEKPDTAVSKKKKKKVNPGIQGAGNGSMSKEESLPLTLSSIPVTYTEVES